MLPSRFTLGKIDHQDQVTAKAAHTEFTNELFFLLRSRHPKEAQGLFFTEVACRKNVQSGNRTISGAERPHLWPQVTNAFALFKGFKQRVHGASLFHVAYIGGRPFTRSLARAF